MTDRHTDVLKWALGHTVVKYIEFTLSEAKGSYEIPRWFGFLGLGLWFRVQAGACPRIARPRSLEEGAVAWELATDAGRMVTPATCSGIRLSGMVHLSILQAFKLNGFEASASCKLINGSRN